MPLFESPVAAEESRSTAAFRRIPENDAANCLYLQLRLLGYRDGYDTFRNELPAGRASLTFKEMAAIGQRLGFRNTPVKLTVSELVSARMPVILHFESRGVKSGQFMLFLWMYEDETKVALIDGVHVTFTEMSRDEFRRSWTGYALIARSPVDWGAWTRRGAAFLICAGLCFYLVSNGDRFRWVA
jgi:ABC-type bacteriocin/lantibiotic exporter with double-glycine peptidase domain